MHVKQYLKHLLRCSFTNVLIYIKIILKCSLLVFISYPEAFHTLADMLGELPSLTQHCKFVFVPGPQDPGVAHVLPR